MRLLALSDTHGLLPELDVQNVDRVVLAGDICPTANHSPKFQRRWLEQCFFEWVEALAAPVYLALGNHDFVADFKAPPNLHYATQAVKDGMLLFSLTPFFFNWAWMRPEDEMAACLEDALSGVAAPIWVTHGPPYGVCDEVRGGHAGSTALQAAITRHRPELVICGHLHEGSPEGWIGDTRIMNVSLVNDAYQQYRQPAIIETRRDE